MTRNPRRHENKGCDFTKIGIRPPHCQWIRISLFASLVLISKGADSMPSPQLFHAPRSSYPTFHEHNFMAACFDASGCQIMYANRYIIDNPESKTSPTAPPGYLRYLPGRDIGIRNFPSPAIVKWRSLDGSLHQESIDISHIFAGQKLLLTVDKSDIPENAYIGPPDIILVVNNKNISVFMRAHIPLRAPIDPSNKYSNFVAEPILAFSKDY